jgi:hypothetical protein
MTGRAIKFAFNAGRWLPNKILPIPFIFNLNDILIHVLWE